METKEVITSVKLDTELLGCALRKARQQGYKFNIMSLLTYLTKKVIEGDLALKYDLKYNFSEEKRTSFSYFPEYHEKLIVKFQECNKPFTNTYMMNTLLINYLQ